MSVRSFEAEILAELRVVAKNSRLRQKDIMEWATTKVKAHPGETLYYLPRTQVHVAVMVQKTQPAPKWEGRKRER